MHSQENGPQAPASDLPVVDSSHSLRAVDEEQVKARTWNGYVCPGCRTVFRVAGDFNGTDVICPSCHETLRLPKNPDEPQPLVVPAPVEPQPVTMATAPPQTHSDKEDGKSIVRSLFSTRDGQIKLALVLFTPLAIISAVLLIFSPGKESPPSKTTADSLATLPEPVNPIESPPQSPPPPPPVAVGEEPLPTGITSTEPAEPPPPSLPGIVPLVSTPELIDTPPPSMPTVQAVEPDHGLVAAIPDKPVVVEKKPAPGMVQETPPETAPPKPRFHTVVKGDTLTRIARKYQADPQQIMKANGMRNDVVRLGHKLVIPPR